MSTSTPTLSNTARPGAITKKRRVGSVDLLRGIVMIIMALDHVRDYFHRAAFVYSPTDLSHTSVFLFFTRFATHYCAPVFVLLAGVSAWLYGNNRTKEQVSFFLITRGLWLVVVELLIVSIFRTFNPLYTFVNFQVIWAIAISMLILAVCINFNRWIILTIGILLVAGHNLLDNFHVPGNGLLAFVWSLLHDPRIFTTDQFLIRVAYPFIPWTGIMLVGYVCGSLYTPSFDAIKRRRILLWTGIGCLLLFVALRSVNIYGDASHWSVQQNGVYSLLSFINVTKYPPSLLYALITLGPAFIFLSLSESMYQPWTQFITIFGRVPMFYYLAHILLIHILAIFAAWLSGYTFGDMVLSTAVNDAPQLKSGYGFPLVITYLVWVTVVVLLFPLCKWFDKYKRDNVGKKEWLSYL